ncbi:MAG: hypothetical protein E7162_04920 [Firmicutes bacterium]|nr:hypothetical protein [Bacillota bacterium]
MVKKYGKYILTVLCAFVASLTSVSAAEMTLEQFGTAVKGVSEDADYVYLIGEYAFTASHELTTQDIMIAARSIKLDGNSGATNKDPIYEAMSMMMFEATYDADWNITGYEYAENVFGSAKEQNTYEIKYIDYVEMKNLEVSGLVEEAYNTIKGQAATDKFEVAINGNDVTITIVDRTMNSVNALAGTGIATAAENLLNTAGVKEVKIAVDENTYVVVTAENLRQSIAQLDALFKVLAGSDEATAADLAGKSLDIEIFLEDGYTAVGSTEFTVSFGVKEVKVDGLVEEAYNTIKGQAATDKFEVAINGNDVTITIVDRTMNSVNALAGTGIATAAENLLNTAGVKEVKIAVDENTYVVVTAENLRQSIAQLDALFKVLAGSDEATAADLAGKSLDIEIFLEDGYTAVGSTEFTIEFDTKPEVTF